MKAIELRIGNLVMRENYLIEKYHKTKNHQIVVGHNDITACVIAPDKFEPIPLTEEWLLKFGFEKAKKPYDNSTIELNEYLVLELMKVGDEFCCYVIKYSNDENLFCLNRIQHVHQLQNLYFALTQEELNAKD